MNTFLAYLKKERMEQLRTSRFMVLMILFLLFGIMNPAIAKLTPWMLEALSGQLAESGMTIAKVTVDALTSWAQFYKNIPMALIIFVLMTSSAFTAEYQKGTLVLVLTKGLQRGKVLAAKALTMLLLWTAGYALCTLVTYGYTGFFWDNGAARHLWLGALLYWLFGVWVISSVVLFSTVASAGTGVLLGTGGTIAVSYLLGVIPGVGNYLPLALSDSMPLLTGAVLPHSMTGAILVTCGLIVLQGLIAALAFRKRSI